MQRKILHYDRKYIILFADYFLNLMCEYHDAHLEFPCSRHYEECISDICSKTEIPFLRVRDLVWTEIDDQSHYDRALKKILPGLI